MVVISILILLLQVSIMDAEGYVILEEINE
jgi:hypothetical protein